MRRTELARTLFLQGYNCSQAVLGAFADVFPASPETVLLLGASFGGGIARMRQVCGTCTAMFMIAGVLRGQNLQDRALKSRHYAFIQSLAEDFSKQHGSIICKELLALRSRSDTTVDNGSDPTAAERTEEYYRTRPCLALIESAVDLTCRRLGIDMTCPS